MKVAILLLVSVVAAVAASDALCRNACTNEEIICSLRCDNVLCASKCSEIATNCRFHCPDAALTLEAAEEKYGTDIICIGPYCEGPNGHYHCCEESQVCVDGYCEDAKATCGSPCNNHTDCFGDCPRCIEAVCSRIPL